MLAAYAGARFEGDSPVYAFPVIFTGAEANNLAAALARPLDAALAGTAVVVPRTFDQQTEQPAAQTETGSAIWGTYPPPTGTDWTWWLIGNAPRLRAFIAWLQQSGGFTVSGTPPQPPKPPAPRFVP